MSKQTISKFVSLGVLGALVLVFGIVLLVLAAGLFVPRTAGPGTGGGIVFSFSRRMSTAALVSLVALIAAGLLLLARGLRR
jgi:hypothetical protein